MLDLESPPPQPASDLVWMLLSNQVDRHHLIHKLVEQYYLQLYMQAGGSLLVPAAAQHVVERTLARLVINAHRFGANQDLDEYIRSLFDREIHRSNRSQKLRTLFRQGVRKNTATQDVDTTQPLDQDQIASYVSRVEIAIYDEHRHLRTIAALQWILIFSLALLLLIRLGWSEDLSVPALDPSPPAVHTRLVTHIIRVTTTPTPTPPPTSLPQSAVLYIIKPGDTLNDISNRTGVDIKILMALNGLQDEYSLVPDRKLMIAFGRIPQALITPTQVTPAPTRNPLTLQSSQEEIIRRVHDHDQNWNTLWLDAQIIDYGPQGYIGPPFIRREQLWMFSNGQGVYLSGLEGNAQPERITLSLNGTEYSYSPDDTRPIIANGGLILDYTQISRLIRPPFIYAGSYKLEVIGLGEIANREVIVIDYSNIEEASEVFQGRYWIDTRTGIPLRLLTYSDDQRILSLEFRITDIRFDQEFPPQYLDPNSGAIKRFAQDPGGTQLDAATLAARLHEIQPPGREPLAKLTPPPDFDPTQSQLTFQFPSLARLGGERDLAEVFASGYYLGTLEFADPWNLACTRSPDGRYIAFYRFLDEEPYRSNLYWFDLLDLAVLHDPLPELIPSWGSFAFSPDNSRVAFVACGNYNFEEEDCFIYLLDLASNIAEQLVPGYGSSLAWSPDGRQLAFFGAFSRNQDFSVHFIDVITREITNGGPLKWDNQLPADPNSPIYAWGITFPNWNTHLEDCAAPPP